MPQTKKTTTPADKRVYDLRVTLAGNGAGRWRQIAVSADCTLAEMYWTIQGAFDQRRVHAHDITIGATRYHDGKGSRTPLRRVVDVDTTFMCSAIVDGRDANVEVTGSQIVRSRRHYPKVIRGGDRDGEAWSEDAFELKEATWAAQDACRGHVPFDDAEPPPIVFTDRPNTPFTRAQFAELDLALRAFTSGISSASALHGFFTAIVSGPMLLPSAWMPFVFGDEHVWNSAGEVQRVLALIMHAYDTVARELYETPENFALLTERRASGSEETARAESWCRGYLSGMAVADDAWKPLLRRKPFNMTVRLIYAIGAAEPDDVLAQALATDATMYRETVATLAPGVVDIYRYFRTNEAPTAPTGTVYRAGPKIGANDPCSCGSGKKYKRCCSPLRAV